LGSVASVERKEEREYFVFQIGKTKCCKFQLIFKAALDACNDGMEAEEIIEIRQIKYLNNIVEQDHRFIKKRTRPTLGFKNFHLAAATITGIENIRMIQKGQIQGCDFQTSTFQNFCTLMT
jgi:putative transposase